MPDPVPLRNASPEAELRRDLAAAFRWTCRMNWHEGVANHFSVMTGEGKKFLMNPDKMHFARIRASDLIELDADDAETMSRPNAPDATAWGLHGALHRRVAHARCAIHLHTEYATVLASLADSRLPPIEQNSAMFWNRHVIDEEFGGLAFEDEGERVAAMLQDLEARIVVMGHHGLLAIGEDVAEAFYAAYYFERAARNYVLALSTGRPLRVMDDALAEKTAREIWAERANDGRTPARKHLDELRLILDAEGDDYAE